MAFLDSLKEMIAGKDNPGYSPEILEDWTSRLGGVQKAMGAVQSARAGEPTAPPEVAAMSPEDRAALDRYTNFAQLAKESDNPLKAGVNYLGGMGAMAATEASKLVPGSQRLASGIYNLLTGNPGGAQFFGGGDTSRPSLANLTSAHYGFTRGRKSKD